MKYSTDKNKSYITDNRLKYKSGVTERIVVFDEKDQHQKKKQRAQTNNIHDCRIIKSHVTVPLISLTP